MSQTKCGAAKVAAGRLGITLAKYKRRRAAGEKHCSKCRSWKLLELFPKTPYTSDGHGGQCLQCGRNNYRAHPRIYGPSPMRGKRMSAKSRDKMRKAHQGSKNHRWKGGVSPHRQRDPLTILARRAVNHAIEAGRLARPDSLPCFDCGKPAKEYDHYRGYAESHWLDVQAVCRRCHRRRYPA